MGTTALISGGVRSGKSAFALRWAEAHQAPRVFIATAQAYDDEMRTRVADHRRERADRFVTVESPLDPTTTLRSLAPCQVVVIDCLTLWLSNLLLGDVPANVIEQRVAELAATLRASSCASIVVSNEVGMGVVPDNALARAFRDIAGRAHQVLAASSDELYLATMGTVLRLRPGPVSLVYP